MFAKILEAMVNNEGIPLCTINSVLNVCGETYHCNCYDDCDECKADSFKAIERLREEALEQSKALDKLNKIEEIIYKLRCDVPAIGHFNDVDNYDDLMNYVEEIRKVLMERQ